jgi:hypothetical protein
MEHGFTVPFSQQFYPFAQWPMEQTWSPTFNSLGEHYSFGMGVPKIMNKYGRAPFLTL